MPREYQSFSGVTDTGRRPSAGIWGDCPWLEIISGHRGGVAFYDDFILFSATDLVPYDILAADTGSSITGLSTSEGGVIRFSLDGTDNDEVGLAFTSHASNGPGMVNIDAGAGNVYFEARFRVSLITTGTLGLAIGLGEIGIMAANTLVDDTGALVDKDFVGFRVDSASGSALDAIYNTASGGGESSHKAEAGTLAASTYIKVGLKYDDTLRKTFYFVNGVVCDPSGVNESATNFPDGQIMVPFVYFKDLGGTAQTHDLDWVRVCQVID
jgi:hypothetical protein